MNVPASFRWIIGKRPWKVWKGHGSFLLFEFGRKKKDSKGHVRGEYCLWIYMADWRLRNGKKEVANSESPDGTIEVAAELFTGKRLEAVVFNCVLDKNCVHYAARFWFEDGLSLEATMYDDRESDSLFLFYTPKVVLSYSYDGSLNEEKRKPTDQSR